MVDGVVFLERLEDQIVVFLRQHLERILAASLRRHLFREEGFQEGLGEHITRGKQDLASLCIEDVFSADSPTANAFYFFT